MLRYAQQTLQMPQEVGGSASAPGTTPLKTDEAEEPQSPFFFLSFLLRNALFSLFCFKK
jgi:hypothetical protein